MEFQLLLYLQAINFLFFWIELEPGCRRYRCALFSLEYQSQIPGVTILQIRKCIFWDYKAVETINCVLYKCHKHDSCTDNGFINLISEHIFIHSLKTYKFFFFNNLDWGPVPRFAPWKHRSQCGLLYNPRSFSKHSYSGRQVPLRPQPAVVPWQPKEELWVRNGGQMVPGICTQGSFIAANLRHGTDNFTSLLKEGMLRIFIAL